LQEETRHNSCVQIDKLSFLVAAVDCAEASETTMSLHEDKRVPFDISERQRAEDALRRYAERQAMLLEVTSDLIRASEPGELGRMTFEHVKSAFGAVVCTNYRLDPAARRLRLVCVHGIPP